jgi:thymidylate synthase
MPLPPQQHHLLLQQVISFHHITLSYAITRLLTHISLYIYEESVEAAAAAAAAAVERHASYPWLTVQAQILSSEEIDKLEMDDFELVDYKKMISKHFLELSEEQQAGLS